MAVAAAVGGVRASSPFSSLPLLSIRSPSFFSFVSVSAND